MRSKIQPMIKDSEFDRVIDRAYEVVAGIELSATAIHGTVEVDSVLLKSIFENLKDSWRKESEDSDRKTYELQLQLDELRDMHTKLQAEYESKFEKNKTVTLSVPLNKNLCGHHSDEKEDSIKSFRPESDDDSEDVKVREKELRAMLAQQKLEEQRMLQGNSQSNQ